MRWQGGPLGSNPLLDRRCSLFEQVKRDFCTHIITFLCSVSVSSSVSIYRELLSPVSPSFCGPLLSQECCGSMYCFPFCQPPKLVFCFQKGGWTSCLKCFFFLLLLFLLLNTWPALGLLKMTITHPVDRETGSLNARRCVQFQTRQYMVLYAM